MRFQSNEDKAQRMSYLHSTTLKPSSKNVGKCFLGIDLALATPFKSQMVSRTKSNFEASASICSILRFLFPPCIVVASIDDILHLIPGLDAFI